MDYLSRNDCNSAQVGFRYLNSWQSNQTNDAELLSRPHIDSDEQNLRKREIIYEDYSKI